MYCFVSLIIVTYTCFFCSEQCQNWLGYVDPIAAKVGWYLLKKTWLDDFVLHKQLQLPRVIILSESGLKSFSYLIWHLNVSFAVNIVFSLSHSSGDFSGSISRDLICIPKALTSLNNHHDLWLNGAVGHSIVPRKVLSWLFLQPKLFP